MTTNTVVETVLTGQTDMARIGQCCNPARHQVSAFMAQYGAPGLSQAGFSSHSLRIGAASAMLAVGVRRGAMRVWFKWKSEGMIDLYARVVAGDAAAQTLYGWMVQAGATFTLYV